MTDPGDRNYEEIDSYDHLSEIDPEKGHYSDEDIFWQGHADSMEEE